MESSVQKGIFVLILVFIAVHLFFVFTYSASSLPSLHQPFEKLQFRTQDSTNQPFEPSSTENKLTKNDHLFDSTDKGRKDEVDNGGERRVREEAEVEVEAEVEAEVEVETEENSLHIVFSTSCNLFQDWQARVLIWSAKELVNQKGKITRIVSGCGTGEQKEGSSTIQPKITKDDVQVVRTHPGGLTNKLVSVESIREYNHQFPDVYTHITPTFDGAKKFPWMNKPLGLNHWLQTKLANSKRQSGTTEEKNKATEYPEQEDSAGFRGNEVIVIIDPDMLFLSPLEVISAPRRFSTKDILCTVTCKNRHLKTDKEKDEFTLWLETVTEKVRRGHPVAQTYGLSSDWLRRFKTPEFPFFANHTEGEKSRLMGIESWQVRHHFSVGPPYFLNVVDFQRLMGLWVKYMKPCYEDDPKDILADMYAYSISAIELDLPHLSLDHYIVSNLKASFEAWKWIDPLIGLNPTHGNEEVYEAYQPSLVESIEGSVEADEDPTLKSGFIPKCSEALPLVLSLNSRTNLSRTTTFKPEEGSEKTFNETEQRFKFKQALKLNAPLFEEFNPHLHVPNFVHLAQYYAANRLPKGLTSTDGNKRVVSNIDRYHSELFFHKGHVPGNIFSCSLPLLKTPPEDYIEKQRMKVNRRGAWVVCTTVELINSALLSWKSKPENCPPQSRVNLDKAFEIVGLKKCTDRHEGVDCWPGAKIAQLPTDSDLS